MHSDQHAGSGECNEVKESGANLGSLGHQPTDQKHARCPDANRIRPEQLCWGQVTHGEGKKGGGEAWCPENLIPSRQSTCMD